MRSFDEVVIDLLGLGSRYATFVWTAVLDAAALRGVWTVVLDRPNPFGGERLEGAPQAPGHRSLVGPHDCESGMG